MTGLGAAALAAACDRGDLKQAAHESHVPGPRDLPDQGWEPIRGRALFAFDGDDLLELADRSLVRRDPQLAERWRLPFDRLRSFVVLADHSVLVLTDAPNGRLVHRVVEGKVATSQPSFADTLLARTAGSYWSVGTFVEEVELAGAAKHEPMHVPENSYVYQSDALADGSVAMANLWGILRFDRTVETFTWARQASHLGRATDAGTVWASYMDGTAGATVALLALANGAVKTIATHLIRDDLVHCAAEGAYAAAVTAKTIAATRAACTLVVVGRDGETWRAPLGEHRTCTVSISATRVAVRSAPDSLRVWNLATGRERT
jgi:hypothetical protein